MDALRPGGHLTSGVNDAKPGIVMEAHPAIGDFYRQEFDLSNAEGLRGSEELVCTSGQIHAVLKNRGDHTTGTGP